MLNLLKKIFVPKNRVRQFAPTGMMILCIVCGELVKMPLVNALTAMRIGENSIGFGLLALKHDLAIFACVTIVFMLSLMMREYIVAVSIRFICTLLAFFWSLDIFVLNFFTTRLSTGDFLKFSRQWQAINTFTGQIFPNQRWLFILSIASTMALIILFVFTKTEPVSKRIIVSILCLSTFLASLYMTDDKTSYVHAWTYQNVYEINMKQSVTREFSDIHTKALDRSPNRLDKRTVCIPGKGEHPNVIILIFESLSMYHSYQFSGLPSMVPNFDRISSENISYTNFFSNGFASESGMISLFTGKHLFPPATEFASANWDSGFFYKGFHNARGSLPSLFKNNGYYTTFLTTGDLGFLNKGKWLKTIGFQMVEGAEQSFYNGWPRLHFGAAPDEALYQRVFEFLPELEVKKPYMLTIETVSTHQPFFNPHDSARDESSVFSMADKSLGIFYDTLKEKGFFTNGTLVILGDHRSMTGLRQEELSLYGRTAASRVPMVIAYGDGRKPERVDSFSQQTDFIPSFEYLIGNQSCTGPLNGNFFHEPAIEAEYVLFPRGDNRNLIDVYTAEDNDATIRINGDDTSFVEGFTKESKEIIRYIGKERLRISRADKKPINP